ncbi:hypothetical protein C8F01DRAFT_1050127 [Mycena amicta]|nr:hypothetical protein C8F01DRAFT_1050127 [Mycena amicta]
MDRVLEQTAGRDSLHGSGPSASSATGAAPGSDSHPASHSLKRTSHSSSEPPAKRIRLEDGLPLPPPRELVIVYEKSRATESQLYRRLTALDVSNTGFSPYISQAKCVSEDAGNCAADLVWRRALKDDSAENQDIREVIKNFPFTIPNLDPDSRSFNVSPKFLRLVQVLKSCEAQGETFRGVVFVKNRATALAIAELMPMLVEHVSFIRAFALTRQGSLQTDDVEQQGVFRKFALGIYNLIVATKSAEDLDIPKATVVIRFDLFDGLPSYAFLWGLTAGKESHLVHMVERSNRRHLHILAAPSKQNPDLIRWIALMNSRHASAVPPTPLDPNFLEPSDDEDEEYAEPTPIVEPVTGGTITPQDSTAVVYRLSSHSKETHFPSPLFEFHVEARANASSLYTCTALLPATLAHGITGQPCSSKAHARRSACYNVCVQLWRAGLLQPDAFLVGNNRSMSSQEKTQDSQHVRVHVHPCKMPDLWARVPSHDCLLFPTVMTVGGWDQDAPIILLTRDPLPIFPSFNLFLSGTPAKIETHKCSPFLVDPDRLVLLQSYTLRICRAVANKPFTCSLESMPYFLAPLPLRWMPGRPQPWKLPDVADAIPWDLVAQAAESWCMPLEYGNAEDVAADIADAVILDRAVELTRRYEALRVRPDLSPLSHPEDSPRELPYANLLEYCKAVRKNFDGLEDENQALIEVSSVLTATSYLDPTIPKQQATGGSSPRYLIPELCLKFTVPASTFRTALLLPSMLRRLDSFLLVKELNARTFRHQISETLLDMAITAPSSRMEHDYERLELLGDSFLKYLASIYVFVNEPSNREGALHVARQHIVSNDCLFRSVDAAGLPPYIQSKPFSIKSWQPPHFRLSEDANVNVDTIERKQKKEREQKLGDKVVSDVAEAILGAAYLSGGRDTALMAAKALKLPFPNVEKWADLRRNLLVPPAKISARLKPGAVEAVEGMINCKLTHQHLLSQALTHVSMSTYESYERLEFIGDAILELLVIRHIFQRDPTLSPGGLTMLKGAMVSNPTLAAVCVESGLYKHVLMAANLYPVVADYAKKLQAMKAEEVALAASEGRPAGQYWQEIEAPKVLSDIVESMIGATYLSDDMTGTEALFNALLKPFFDQYLTMKAIGHHPTKTLFERMQAHKCQKFQIVKEKNGVGALCHVVVHDVVLASGEGASTALAARQASWCALDALEGDTGFLRVCDCPKDGKERKDGELDDILSKLGD